jgi:hypothetical protein
VVQKESEVIESLAKISEDIVKSIKSERTVS